MIDFTLTAHGETATHGDSSVVITNIILCDSLDSIIGDSITNFSGDVVRDDIGIGDYVVIDFSVTLHNENSTVTKIKLIADNNIVAVSENISLVAQANKRLKLRITARIFTSDEISPENRSSKINFNCISIGLPYATKFRQGVVRFAKSVEDTHLDNTVLSASDTLASIRDAIHVAGEYIPWDTESGTPVNGTFTAHLMNVVDSYAAPTYTYVLSADSSGFTFNAPITGSNAVTSTPNYSTTNVASSAITGDSKLVTSSYISSIYSNSIDTATTETDNARKLVTSHAVRSYVENLNSSLVHTSGAETISGVKTFSDGIVSNSTISGTGVYSSYTDASWATATTQLPTVAAVTAAITALENSTQSLIDAINAGQNLADIVDSKSDLIALSTTDLKAKGEYKKGSSGATWSAGDKVQVLHDKTKADGTQDATVGYKGIPTVYELVKGTATANTQDAQSTSNNAYYWDYIGEYGSDSYSKSEVDSTFINQNKIATSSTICTYLTSEDYVPSVKAAESQYVKLNSSAVTQTITSPLKLYNRSNDTSYMTIASQDDSSGGVLSNITSYSKNTKLILASRHYSTLAVNNVTKVILDGQGNTSGSGPGLGNFSVCGESYGTDVKMFSLEQTSSKYDANGSYVASYRDYSQSGATLSDGRLVTVDYLNNYINSGSGGSSSYAQLSSNNTFTGTVNTFDGISATSYTGTGVYSSYIAGSNTGGWDNSSSSSKIPTVSAVNSAIEDAKLSISSINTVGSIGLFIYTEHDASAVSGTSGAEKSYGSEINGAYLKAVGMSLPTSGQISYRSAALVPALSGTWKLLSLAVQRSATEPCLVMAQKIHNEYPIPSPGAGTGTGT